MLEFLVLATLPVIAYYALLFAWKKLRPPRQKPAEPPPYRLALPLRSGKWQAFNSPASKVPSHGTEWLAQRYAIDLVGYDPEVGYSAVRDWRSRFWLEPPQRFFGFDAPVVAPEAGTVVAVYDGIDDRLACRSWPGMFWFYLSSLALPVIAVVWRSAEGLAPITGNHAIIRLDCGPHIGLMHLRRGSLQVKAGDVVRHGDVIGRVGNSGNTTQPHLHLQVMDGPDLRTANPWPMQLAAYELLRDGDWTEFEVGMPANHEVIRPKAV